jgi:hydroxymethylglutaryl-CoA reductase
MKGTSRIVGFFKLSLKERLERIKDWAGLSKEEVDLLLGKSLTNETADRMIENVIGTVELPLGIATNFLINSRDYLIPMAIEEPSVVAAASNAARMAREKGGFLTSSTGSTMIGQIQAIDVRDPYAARFDILSRKEEILELANEQDPVLVSLGGGARDIEVRVIQTKQGEMVIIHLLVDCVDAMGANTVNTMSEAVASLIGEITSARVLLRIISNFADKRLMRAKVIFSKEAIGGPQVVDAILSAYSFASTDIYRAATHNKGIMNGVDAVVIATGNDFRAVEAGAHAYASRFGRYEPLTNWEENEDGHLVGTIEIPIAVGIVGGAVSTNPTAKISLKILNVSSSHELGEVMAAVGLAQNFAALRALATEGIQRGHMRLHARNVAVAAGAEGERIDEIAEIMVKDGKIRADRAKELLEEG